MGTFTFETGFGLLAVGLIVLSIGATIFFIIVNKMEKNKEEEKQQKEWEKKYGSR